MLPFSAEEVLTPGGTKLLHLYEERYKRLMEDVMQQGKLFVHVVVTTTRESPAARMPGAYVGDNFVMALGTLVKVIDLRSTPHMGYQVRIQAEGRVSVKTITQLHPYIKGAVIPIHDAPATDLNLIRQRAEHLEDIMRDVQNLSQKFRSEESANLRQAMVWVGQDPLMRVTLSDSGEQEAAARLSFAALQSLPETSKREKFQVARRRLIAMESTDTAKRLQHVAVAMREAKSMLAAKCAIKTLDLS